jgi:Rod binding domain-containing protein
MGDASIQAMNPLSLLLTLPSATPPALQPPAGVQKPSAMPLDPKAMDAAKKFEAVLINRLTQEMKRTIPDSGLLSSAATDQFQDLFWNQLSDEIGRKGGLGLAQQIYNQMISRTTTARPVEPGASK